jgi:gas vesicle protein
MNMSHKHAVSFFTGLSIGGVIGAASVLFLAQQSGKETRRQIRDKGIELKEKTETAYAQVREKFETTVADLQTRLGKGTRNLGEEAVLEAAAGSVAAG